MSKIRVMDYKERYEELLEKNKQLEKELECLHVVRFMKKTRMRFYKQTVAFEKFAEMLPEMIYEIDISGKII